MKSAQVSQILLASESAPDFLFKYVEARKSTQGTYSYAELARAARITSRSFIRDIITGRRYMTLETSRKISAGLKLTNDQGKYLDALVSLERAQKANDKELTGDIHALLTPLKKKLSAANKKVVTATSSQDTFGTPEWPYIYSSLADENTGVTLEQIGRKSQVPLEKCKTVLAQLTDLKVVETRTENQENLYFPTAALLNFDKLSGNYFKDSFLNNTQRLMKSAEDGFTKNSDRLFLDAIFSIDSKQLPAFRSALQKRLLETIQEFENPHGDDIATFVGGFFPRSDSNLLKRT